MYNTDTQTCVQKSWNSARARNFLISHVCGLFWDKKHKSNVYTYSASYPLNDMRKTIAHEFQKLWKMVNDQLNFDRDNSRREQSPWSLNAIQYRKTLYMIAVSRSDPAKLLWSHCEIAYQRYHGKSPIGIFPIAGVMSVYTHTRVCILFGYNVCASRIHTIDRGWMREKEKEGEEKKRERKDVETTGVGGRETANARKYKEPDIGQGIFLLSIFFTQGACDIFRQNLDNVLSFTN